MADNQDLEILRACKRPGTAAYEEGFRLLYSKYRDMVFRVSLKFTGNATDAMDAAQEAFIQVYRKLGDFKCNSKFSSWLYRIAVNCSIDVCRRRKKKESCFVDLENSQDLFFGKGLPRVGSPKTEKSSSVDFSNLLSVLSPKLRVVIILRYLEDLSYAEIAEALQVAIGTVKSRLSRAHLALGEYLKSKEMFRTGKK